MIHYEQMELGGRILSIETGRLAKQAKGAALVKFGDTVVLVTACAKEEPRADIDFLPLTVDYRENTYAAGKIPGGFFKREGRPNEKEILTSRLIDRPIRPLFPKAWHNETQVVGLVLSADMENDPDTMSITAASTALYLSEIPFTTPIAGVRVGMIDGQLLINPSTEQLKTSRLNLMVAGSIDAIVMVEAGAKEVSESEMVEAISFAHEQIKRIVQMQMKLYEAMGIKKLQVEEHPVEAETYAAARQKLQQPIVDALRTTGKLNSEAAVKALKQNFVADGGDDAQKKSHLEKLFQKVKKDVVRWEILDQRRRFDGRAFNETRGITSEVGILPRTHGSAVFTRGETQALVTATLGTGEDVQRMDVLSGEYEKKFMLHYNFPPFSVGEVSFLRGPGRREIGHGALAERAIFAMMPPDDVFPYTVRLVSDILESNGSSSMATVCGGVLALMDAGVPLKAPVAGIAMGLVKEGDKYAILTDIAGVEDHYGDMDFKVAGTSEGITALQMDIKITGLTKQIMQEALQQAREARLLVLEKMNATLSKPREMISPWAPRIITLKIPVSKIGELIGPGGKTIRSIIEQTGVKIDVNDDGSVCIASTDETAARRAVQMVEDLTAEAEVGKVYMGTVVRVEAYGAFVQILPKSDGLLHISEIADYRVREVRDEINEGDKIVVKVIGIDADKRIKLSRRAVSKEEGGPDPAAPRPPRPEGEQQGEHQPAQRQHEGGYGGRPPRSHDRGGPPRRDHDRGPRR
ncbi:MAG: polyribonucleotide nucleotidyltransferase [Acidobacteria bacterium]|nr:polyribonucleotide nucleotidyltransferase [Acidobacteriota bacterium]